MGKRDAVSIGHYYSKTRLKDASGKAIFIRELAAELEDLSEVVVYSGIDHETAGTPPYDVVDIPTFGDALPSTVRRLVPLLGTDDMLSLRVLATGIRGGLVDHINSTVDVLVTHYYLDDIVLSNLVDVPVVYQYHGFSDVGLGGKAREHLSATEFHLANSKTTEAEVSASLDREVDHIVTPGVDVDQFHPDAEPAFDPSEPAIMFVGRLAEAKGVFDLLAAFQAISDDAQLYLVGDADGQRGQDAKRQLSRQLRELGLEDDVTFLGEVAHEEIHRYYAASDIVCYPTYYDGFGLVNLEAMACGKPVVTTSVDGVEEYATDGENSLLVEPGNRAELRTALDRLVSSPALRDQLGTAGRTVAEQYSWRAQAESMLDFCTGIDSEPSVPSLQLQRS